MQVLGLLCAILSNFITSLTLSFLLAIRSLLSLRSFSSPVRDAVPELVSIYEGTVWHERRRPVHHSFRYDVRYALIDLDNTSHVPPGHLSAEEARRVSCTTGPVFLLTIPPSVGYEQNPLSIYYCYDLEDSSQSPKKCIAEVTNTPWNERVLFVFNPCNDLVAKPLHVSPLMDMHGNWRIRTSTPGENLFVGISVHHPTLGDYFSATLTAKRIPTATTATTATMADIEIFFWLMPHRVAFWIYWHALRLWWKNVAFVPHPKYTNPSYRADALLRDGMLRCCGVAERCRDDDGGCDSQLVQMRYVRWRDAKWPWA